MERKVFRFAKDGAPVACNNDIQDIFPGFCDGYTHFRKPGFLYMSVPGGGSMGGGEREGKGRQD